MAREKSVIISVYVRPDLKAKIKALADEEHRSESQMVTILVERGMAASGKAKAA